MQRSLAWVGVLLGLLVLACQPAPAAKPTAPVPSSGAPAAPPASAAGPAAPGAASAANQSAAPAAPASVKKLTVAIVSPSEVFSIPWVGRDSGIFLKHGFDVEVPLVTGSPRLTQSLIAGDFDYAMMGATALLRARVQGADPLILATTHNFATQNVMVRQQAGIQRLAEIKGRIVGVSQIGSEADVFLEIALGLVGLKPDDVQVIQTGGHPQTVAAMVSGNLDVGVLGGANVLRAQQAGVVKLAGARDLNVLSPSGIVATTQRYIDRDRDSVHRFMRAWVEAIHYFKTQREDTIRILQANLGGLELDEITFLYEDMAEAVQPLPVPADGAIQAMLDREDDPAARTHKPSEFMDLSFLREIEQSGFVSALYK